MGLLLPEVLLVHSTKVNIYPAWPPEVSVFPHTAQCLQLQESRLGLRTPEMKLQMFHECQHSRACSMSTFGFKQSLAAKATQNPKLKP